ncbi:AraC family transcriptional regulator [Enterocloster clostridioformis]
MRTILAWVFRIVLSRDCLIHTDKQMAQIVQEAGYANLSNFTRRFKSSENMTPGQCRYLYGDGKKIWIRYGRYDGVRNAASPAIFLFGGRNGPSVADAKNFGICRKFSVLSEIKPFTSNKFLINIEGLDM